MQRNRIITSFMRLGYSLADAKLCLLLDYLFACCEHELFEIEGEAIEAQTMETCRDAFYVNGIWVLGAYKCW